MGIYLQSFVLLIVKGGLSRLRKVLAVMITWGADVFSGNEEYQNILKYYLRNLVISYIDAKISWNFI